METCTNPPSPLILVYSWYLIADYLDIGMNQIVKPASFTMYGFYFLYHPNQFPSVSMQNNWNLFCLRLLLEIVWLHILQLSRKCLLEKYHKCVATVEKVVWPLEVFLWSYNVEALSKRIYVAPPLNGGNLPFYLK